MDMYVDSVKIVNDKGLMAFISLRIGNYILDGVKVVETDGFLLVAVPQKPSSDRCPRCKEKNSILANFCEGCGLKRESKNLRLGHKRHRIYHDIFYPVSPEARAELETMVLAAYYDAIK